MTNQELEHLETTENQYWVDLNDSLNRLMKNHDFQQVILDGYLKNKSLGAVSMLGRPDIKKRGERPDVIEELVAISNLQQYLFTVIPNLAGSAKVDMEDGE